MGRGARREGERRGRRGGAPELAIRQCAASTPCEVCSSLLGERGQRKSRSLRLFSLLLSARVEVRQIIRSGSVPSSKSEPIIKEGGGR